MTTERTDTERLNWLAEQDGFGVISDDGGRWAVPTSGDQPIPEEEPQSMYSTFFVEHSQWKESVRAAIDAAIDEPEYGNSLETPDDD